MVLIMRYFLGTPPRIRPPFPPWAQMRSEGERGAPAGAGPPAWAAPGFAGRAAAGILRPPYWGLGPSLRAARGPGEGSSGFPPFGGKRQLTFLEWKLKGSIYHLILPYRPRHGPRTPALGCPKAWA